MTFSITLNPNLFVQAMKEGFPDTSRVKDFPPDAQLIDVLFDRETGVAELVFETNKDLPSKTMQILMRKVEDYPTELSLVPTSHQSMYFKESSDFESFARKEVNECIELFRKRQETHGDAWQGLDLIDLASMIFVKAMREKEASRSQKEKSVQEEHLRDLINYVMMGLYRLSKEKK